MLLLAVRPARAVSGTENDFFQNTSLAAPGNYAMGAPTNSHDVLLTTSSGPLLTLSAATRNMASLNLTKGASFTIGNSTSTATASAIRLGGGGTTNGISGANGADLLFISNNSSLTIQGPNSASGTGVLGVALLANGNFDVTTGSTLSISASISGAFALQKLGGGTLTLSGTNTFGGAGKTFTIDGGTVNAASASALGSAAGGLVVNSGGTLNVNTASITVTSLSGTAGGVIATTAPGTAVLEIATTSAGVNAGTFAGTIQDGGLGKVVAFQKSGPGTQTLAGANSYSGGTNIVGDAAVSTLALGANHALPVTTTLTLNANDSGAAVFDLAGFDQTVGTIASGALSGGNTATITNSGASLKTLELSLGGTTFRGSLQDGAGGLALKMSGPTRLTLSGANTYSGGTLLAAGSIGVSADANLGAIAGSLAFTGASTLAATDTFSTLRAFILSADATFDVAADKRLTLSGAISGANALTKSGAGVLEIAADNSALFAGAIVVDSGTLFVSNASGSATGSGGVTVRTGAAFAGSGAISGALTLESGAMLSPDAGIATLKTGALAMNAASVFALDLDPLASQQSDLVLITGDFTLSGVVQLSIAASNLGDLAAGARLTFATYTGARSGFFRVSGFDYDITDYSGEANPVTFTVAGEAFAIDYDYADGNFPGSTAIALVHVPEPGPASAFAAGLVLASTLGRRSPRRAVLTPPERS